MTTVYVLTIDHSRGDDVSVHADDEGAIAAAAAFARQCWKEVAGHGSYIGTIPNTPPADDQLAVRLYFDTQDGHESYSITAHEVQGETPPDPPRYGYVNYHTPFQRFDDGVTGQWAFRLADTVTDFAKAWEAAVYDFACHPFPWRDAKAAGHPFNYGDLIGYPDVLARHGLTYVPDPPAAGVVTVDHDDILVDSEDGDRCMYEQDGEYCGAVIDGDGTAERCSQHAR